MDDWWIDYHLNIILKACEAMAEKQGNKKAEELDRLIQETRKNQRDPKIPANPAHREEKDK